MAGDWIKMRWNLATDPAVLAVAATLDIEEDLVIGKLHRLWTWADQQTTDGNAHGVTKAWLDRYMGVTGFADALAKVGWLACENGGVQIPGFAIHMGKSAKSRAQGAVRTARSRQCNAVSVTETLPEKRREEKRREETDNNTPAKRAEGDSAKPTNGAYPGFDAWFDAYPRGSRRVGKKKCLARWKRDNLEPRADELLANLEAWKVSEEWTKDGGKFICGPLPFLNQERYDLAESDLKPGNVDRTAQPYARTRDWREALDEAKRQERTA